MAVTNNSGNGKPNAVSPSFAEITPLREPHVYAAISKDPQTMSLKYLVMEPTLTDQEKSALKAIKGILFQVLDVDMRSLGSTEDSEKWLKEKIRRNIND